MKRDYTELDRETWWEDGRQTEKVLIERRENKSPYAIMHLEGGIVVKRELYKDKDAAVKAFGGGAS